MNIARMMSVGAYMTQPPKRPVGRPPIGERPKTQTELHRDWMHAHGLVRLPAIPASVRDKLKMLAEKKEVPLKTLVQEILQTYVENINL